MAQSDTTSGTAASSSLTFTALIDRAQVLLNDEAAATWDTEMVGTFINDAIRDYSQHFPRQADTTINMTTGTSTYNLPADLLAVHSVEYPTGETPRAYLSRLPVSHSAFSCGQNWYDYRRTFSSAAVPTLTLSATVATGESAAVIYAATHAVMDDPSSPTGTNTVPDQHQPLLMKYVLWQATNHLLMAEQQSPSSNSSLLMAQLSQDAGRLERAYQTAVRQAMFDADGESQIVPWITSGTSLARIY
jgi:hypothetical protein